MAIYEVYSQPVKFRYKSTLCSKSTIFSVIMTVLTVTLPFLLAYRSHGMHLHTRRLGGEGFWLKSSSYREQPQVNFKHDYLLYLETENADSPIFCSNLPVTQEFDYCTVIKSREEDSNQDGYNDKLIMDVEVEVPSNLAVFSLQIVLTFDVILQKHCLLQMEGAGYVQFTSGLPFSRLEITGDLNLVQKELLRSSYRDTRYNASIFDLGSDGSMLSLHEAMRNYGKREISTSIQNLYLTWTRGTILDEPFTVSIQVAYPEQVVHYRPPFWQVMKWAWMQYAALLVVSLHIGRWAKAYVFANHLVPTMREVPWIKGM